MAGKKRTQARRTKKISKATAQTTLYENDEKELQRVVNATGKTRAMVLREWAASAVRAKKLQEVGKVEALSDVINAQRSVVSASHAPLIAALQDQKKFVESTLGHIQIEYALIETRLARIENVLRFLVKGFDRVLENIVLIRAYFYFYIFEFYYTVMVSTGSKLTREQLRSNVRARNQEIKIAAAKERSFLGEHALENTAALVANKMIADAKNPPQMATTNSTSSSRT